jgi:hypothetical protein
LTARASAVRSIARGRAGARGIDRLADDQAGLLRVLLQELGELGVEGHAERGHVGRVVGMVGGHERDLGAQLAAPVAPQQVDQAVVLARDEHGHPLGPVGVGQPPAHGEALAHVAAERLRQRVQLAAPERELHAHEELAALGIGRVLVGADDVGAGRGEEAGDRRDDAVPIWAGDQQAAVQSAAEPMRRGTS